MLILSILMGTTAMLSGCTRSSESKPKAVSSVTTPAIISSSPTTSASETASSIVIDSELELRIHLNQVGYLPDGPKVFVIAADEPFPELKVSVADRHDNEKVVWKGVSPAARQDAASGDWVSQVDFGKLTTEGWYHINVAGNESLRFFINKEVYKELFINVARSYKLQRSGEAIDDPLIGLKLQPGHLQDKEATLFFKDEKGQQPTLDVHGGWYDAGDYGKYIPVAAVTVAQLMLAYEVRPAFFEGRRLLHDREKTHWKPAKAAPDVLSEVKFELDWMLRMQREDGAVYHKVSGGSFPGFILPAEDVQDRSIYGLSTYGTAMFTAATAMAARIYEPFDPVYAKKLLTSSKKAAKWLDANPDAFFRVDEGQNSGSGPYEKSSDREERFWAQAELLKTTGDRRYDATIQREFADLQSNESTFISWANAQLLGQWAVVTSSLTPSAGKEVATQAIIKAADGLVDRVGMDGYRSSLLSKEYSWASNKNALAQGELMLLANELQSNRSYVDGAADQLHYVLGRNAMGTSYVTGVGTKYPLHPHHRISAASGILVPGLLVGGPNQDLNDPVLEKMANQGLPPAKSFVDDLSSYASNEYAIDYNAPLFFTLAFME